MNIYNLRAAQSPLGHSTAKCNFFFESMHATVSVPSKSFYWKPAKHFRVMRGPCASSLISARAMQIFQSFDENTPCWHSGKYRPNNSTKLRPCGRNWCLICTWIHCTRKFRATRINGFLSFEFGSQPRSLNVTYSCPIIALSGGQPSSYLLQGSTSVGRRTCINCHSHNPISCSLRRLRS